MQVPTLQVQESLPTLSDQNSNTSQNSDNILIKADQITLQPNSQTNSSLAASRILEPSSKNVDSIDAARVLNVYDQLLIQTKIVLNLPKIKKFLESDTSLNELAIKANIMNRLNLILEMKEKVISDPDDTTIQNIETEARHLCRSFHNASDLEKVVIAMIDLDAKKNKSKDETSILKIFDDLKVIMSEKLRTLPSEELKRQQYLINMTSKQKQNTIIMNKLELQLQEAEDQKNRELTTLNEELRKLKSDLYQLEQFTEEQIRRTRNEVEKQNQSDSKNSETRQKKLKLEIDNLNLKHGKLLVSHQTDEVLLRRKNANIEKQIEEWRDKYDGEAGDLQDQFDEENDEYESLKSKHKELTEIFSILEVDYNKIMEERRILNEKLERERREIEEKTDAAQVIQAFFRSYKVRKAIKGKGKKGKGKKGKK